MARFRLPALLAATVLYLAVIVACQTIAAVPTMRLDGSGLTVYSSAILGLQVDGNIRRFLAPLIDQSTGVWLGRAVAFALMLVLITFGAFSLLYFTLIQSLRRTFSTPVRVFPWLTLAVYLLMATSLALDDRKLGSPEELMHRPFAWAYFVIVIWCAGATYHRFFGDAAPSDKRVCRILALGVVVLMAVPVGFGRGVETLKTAGIGFQRLPACQVAVATFIHENSEAHEVFQDSSNDPQLILSALAERQPFAIDSGGVRTPSGMDSRLDSLRQLKTTSDRVEAAHFMKTHAIKWYVVEPSDRVQWSHDVASPPIFECGGYKVYGF
jgi:hypothetical protein